MEFTDYMWIKFGLLTAAAFVWGLLGGATGSQGEGKRDKRPD